MKRKSRFEWILLIIVAIALITLPLISACTEQVAKPVPKDVPKETPVAKAWSWPPTIRVIAPQVGTSSHSAATAWAGVLEQKTGSKVRLLAEGISVAQARMAKDFDLWAGTLVGSIDMVEALSGFQARDIGPMNLRLVYTLGAKYQTIVVPGNSPIKEWKDIKPGTRYALWDLPVFKSFYHQIREYLGFTEEQFPAIPFGSFATAVKACWEGKADMYAILPTTAPLAYEQASTPQGLRYIGFPLQKDDPKGYERCMKISPPPAFGVCPQGYGIKEGWGINMYRTDDALRTLANVDTEFMYNIAKWLDENFDAYKDKFQQCTTMSIKDQREVLDYTYMPVHDGTVKYMKEKGLWTAADDKRNQYYIKLTNMYIEAFKSAVAKADQQKIEVAADNKIWLDFWENYKKEAKIDRITALTDQQIVEKLATMK